MSEIKCVTFGSPAPDSRCDQPDIGECIACRCTRAEKRNAAIDKAVRELMDERDALEQEAAKLREELHWYKQGSAAEASEADRARRKLSRVEDIMHAYHCGDDGEMNPGQARKAALEAIAEVLGDSNG